MATAFAPKHSEELPLDNLTAEQFLSLAIETSYLLGWVFGNTTKTGFVAYTNNGLFQWNAEIKLKIKNELAILQSQSRGDDIIDVRENKKNIQRFVSTFTDLKKMVTPEELASKYQDLKTNFVSR
jgi:rhomboid protease GluP